ncbi:MAG: carboxypeptidase regulatory-like domain-containing protein [Candidatus Bathyarchaeota archaeon]|nr:carboxypeptidase regulatory-like domain-containing protein [Candidatus Bathyarchaeum sp.]
METVDAALMVGVDTSIVLDSFDRPHISYFDDYWDDLKYARWTGSAWSVEPVDTVGNVGHESSIALDSSNYAHISCIEEIDASLGYLKYARWTGLTWSVESVSNASGLSDTCIAVDSGGYPHIVFQSYEHGYVWYARKTGSGWSVGPVDSSEPSGCVSLALDSLDRAHISYNVETSRDLKYARWTGTTWSIETVESSGEVGRSSSIALDSMDRPHISYEDGSNFNLKYARWTGSAWSIETVDAAASVGQFTSLALDSIDRPHIGYSDHNWLDLKYARWTDLGWLIWAIDTVGNVGPYVSIDLDSSDHAHISYWDWDNFNLKYARDPDETFFSVTYTSFDDDGDGKDDAVEVIMDVDTTHLGALNVGVFGFLVDDLGQVYGQNSGQWQITGGQVELEKLILKLPEGAPEGSYDILVYVEDDGLTIEDTRTLSNAGYLYPPDTSSTGTLQGTVTDVDTGLPMEGVEIYVDDENFEGAYKAETDATGQYSMELIEGEHLITAHESEGSMYDDSSVNVNIVKNTVTIQDFQLQRTNWLLSISVVGSGTTDPAVGFTTFSIGSSVQVEAFPEEGWVLDHWDLDGADVGDANPFSVTMDSDHSLVAVFTESGPSNWILVIEVAGSGYTSPGVGEHQFSVGAEVVVEAFPSTGWSLCNWIFDSSWYGPELGFPVVMDGDHELIAVFVEESSMISVVESCGSGGGQKDVFGLGEDMYVSGSGFPASAVFEVYVVEDVEVWSDGMTIPLRVSGTAETVSSDGEGYVSPTKVWSNLQAEGQYDVVVDVDDNGRYDVGVDALDDGDIEVSAGVQVIPEFGSWIFLALFVVASLVVIFYSRRS